MAGAVHVKGLRELERAFALADKAVRQDLREALAESAAPVRADAQLLAGSQIRNLHARDPWTGMRVGVGRAVAYVAPVERGRKSRRVSARRPNLKNLLLDRAMEPALERNREKIGRRFEHLLDEVADVWERA